MNPKMVRCVALLCPVLLGYAPVLAQTAAPVTLMTAGDGSGTLVVNAANNRIMPFHPGAMRFYAEAGVKLP